MENKTEKEYLKWIKINKIKDSPGARTAFRESGYGKRCRRWLETERQLAIAQGLNPYDQEYKFYWEEMEEFFAKLDAHSAGKGFFVNDETDDLTPESEKFFLTH